LFEIIGFLNPDEKFETGSYQRAREMTTTRCRGGSRLLLLELLRLQSVVVVHLVVHVPLVHVLDEGVAIVLVLLLLLDLMLNL